MVYFFICSSYASLGNVQTRVCVSPSFLYSRKLELKPVICPGGTDVRYVREVSPRLRCVYFEWNGHVITVSSWHKSLSLLSCWLHFPSWCISLLIHVSMKLPNSILYNIVVIETLLPYI
jgi:hypothetical protein